MKKLFASLALAALLLPPVAAFAQEPPPPAPPADTAAPASVTPRLRLDVIFRHDRAPACRKPQGMAVGACLQPQNVPG